MLIQIVFFILMLFGVAALTVDLGLVHLTQTQMQTAADAAALEGLRGRDTAAACAPLDSVCLEAARRAAASQIAAQSIAEPGFNLDESTDPAALRDRDLNALQYLHPDRSGMYVPSGIHRLQSNPGNEEYGDMVSGCYASGVPPTEESIFLEGQPYHRQDFNTDPVTCSAPTSFLVRLRRTDHRADHLAKSDRDSNVDPTQGVSSSGETLPLLFGLSLPIQKETDTKKNPEGYSPRVNGITVRATAIADLRNALRIGPPQPSVGLRGSTPFALTLSCWYSLAPSSTTAILTASDAFGDLMSVACSAPGQSAGKYYHLADATHQLPYTVSLPVVLPATYVPPLDASVQDFYVPIYDDGPGITNGLVVGFGAASVTTSGGAVTLTPKPSTVAPANATAVVPGGFAVPSPTLDAVLAANLAMPQPLLAPVLAR